MTRNFSLTCDFNPLHHEGGDLHFRHTFQPLGPISIHSTTRVETSVKDISDILTDISIHSTTRVETDIISGPSAALEFQSTPPRGWRLMRYQTSRVVEYFNPLHHEGGDSRRLQSPVRLSDFNPLHHEGGDNIPDGVDLPGQIFQSTPPRGWRPWSYTTGVCSTTFQSTPPRGWRL